MEYHFLLARDGADRDRPAQRLLYANLRKAILEGRLGAGHRLPSSRDLAAELDLARNTVIYAFEQLCAEGYLLSSRRGTVVTAIIQPPPAARRPRPAGRVGVGSTQRRRDRRSGRGRLEFHTGRSGTRLFSAGGLAGNLAKNLPRGAPDPPGVWGDRRRRRPAGGHQRASAGGPWTSLHDRAGIHYRRHADGAGPGLPGLDRSGRRGLHGESGLHRCALRFRCGRSSRGAAVRRCGWRGARRCTVPDLARQETPR